MPKADFHPPSFYLAVRIVKENGQMLLLQLEGRLTGSPLREQTRGFRYSAGPL